MSMYTSVYFRGLVPKTADVEKTLADMGMLFTINDGLEIEGHSGYLPMTYEEFEDEIGTEVLFSTGPPIVEKFTANGVETIEVADPSFTNHLELSVRSGLEGAAGLALAAAIAKLTGGVIFDQTAGEVASIDQTLTEARAFMTAG